MIEARVLDIQPHPDQATNNPGCWAIQLEVSLFGCRRTFWRWHTERASHAKPKTVAILKKFWIDTFGDLHGFSFGKDEP